MIDERTERRIEMNLMRKELIENLRNIAYCMEMEGRSDAAHVMIDASNEIHRLNELCRSQGKEIRILKGLK